MSRACTYLVQPSAHDNNTGSRYRRAAGTLWLIGLIEAVVFGLLGALLAGVAAMSPDRLTAATSGEALDRVLQLQPVLGAWAGAAFAFGFVPGLVYLAASPGVRAGRGWLIWLGMVVMATQCAVLIALLADNAAAAFASHQPAQLTFHALTSGSVLLLLGVGVYRMWQIRPASTFSD